MKLVCVTGASEPLLCKFADGGQKKRQSQAKYVPNGRTWTRDAEVRLVSPVHNCLYLWCWGQVNGCVFVPWSVMSHSYMTSYVILCLVSNYCTVIKCNYWHILTVNFMGKLRLWCVWNQLLSIPIFILLSLEWNDLDLWPQYRPSEWVRTAWTCLQLLIYF